MGLGVNNVIMKGDLCFCFLLFFPESSSS